jgi:dimethylaniline monooxygenase (N-oxide forming)
VSLWRAADTTNRPLHPFRSFPHFSGAGGTTHAFAYKQPESYRGLRVPVAGCSISALEIASDLAMLGAARVISTNRSQRYILQKLLASVPLDQLAFRRFAALWEEYLSSKIVDRGLKNFITQFQR